MTRAPASARRQVASGAATACSSATTRMPSSGFAIASPRLRIGQKAACVSGADNRARDPEPREQPLPMMSLSVNGLRFLKSFDLHIRAKPLRLVPSAVAVKGCNPMDLIAGLSLAAGLSVALLAGLALFNWRAARKAERRWPAKGRFIEVAGFRLHYLDRGSGPPLVLLHGNGAMAADFEASGLIDRLALSFRVIAIDRPGFGYSARPRGRSWNAQQQAYLIGDALRHIGIGRAIVLGHSWGTLVALELALERPQCVAALVLVSGYYFPSI